MTQQNMESMLALLRSELAPATGCTEPAAIGLCAAAASRQLGEAPVSLRVEVSDYMLKNAMNVGIPGMKDVGLDIAAAMGAVSAQPEKGLAVLGNLTEAQHVQAKALAAKTTIELRSDVPKVYIHVQAHSTAHMGEAIIQDTHTHIALLGRDGVTTLDERLCADRQEAAVQSQTPGLPEIWTFAQTVPAEKLSFLDELIKLNESMAHEGLEHAYGLRVGQKLMDGVERGFLGNDAANYIVAVTAAAADARMSGREQPVMSVAGSGNQGLTASLPIIAAAEKAGLSRDELRRCLAVSLLVTIHVKSFIGRLSVLCGCGVASAIGVTAALVYMQGGTREQAEMGIRTMIADLSGMVCDGAKPGCALKIATAVSAAMRAATLALAGIGATAHDGIVAEGVEDTLKNLGALGTEGMAGTNRAILDMLMNKHPETISQTC